MGKDLSQLLYHQLKPIFQENQLLINQLVLFYLFHITLAILYQEYYLETILIIVITINKTITIPAIIKYLICFLLSCPLMCCLYVYCKCESKRTQAIVPHNRAPYFPFAKQILPLFIQKSIFLLKCKIPKITSQFLQVTI